MLPGTARPRRLARPLAAGQGAYYAATGAWALLDIDSFMAVTGPKQDVWLVKTVGVLVTVLGGVLLLAAAKDRVTPDLALLAAGSALGLAAIDIWYAGHGVISPVYLADAAVEVGLTGAWGVAATGKKDKREE